jgi:hypothetical protein
VSSRTCEALRPAVPPYGCETEHHSRKIVSVYNLIFFAVFVMILCDVNGNCDPVKLSGHYHDSTTGCGRDFVFSRSEGRAARDIYHFRWKKNVASILPFCVPWRVPTNYQWARWFTANTGNSNSGDAWFISSTGHWLSWLQYFSIFSIAASQFWDCTSVWQQIISTLFFIYPRTQYHFDT